MTDLPRRKVIIGVGAAVLAGAGATVIRNRSNNSDDGRSRNSRQTGDPVWSLDLGRVEEVSHPPTIVDETLYVVSTGDDSDVIHALSTEGESRWSAAIPDSFESTNRGSIRGIAFDSESVYVGLGGDPVVAALDNTDGSVQWERDHWPSSNANGLTLHDGTLYFGGTKSEVSAGRQRGLAVVDAETGDEINYKNFDKRLHGRPAVHEDVAYFPLDHDEFVAYDLAEDQIRWTLETEPEEDFRHGPTVVDDTLYFSTFGGYRGDVPPSRLYEYNLSDGSENWEIERDDLTPTSRLVVRDDALYFASQWSIVSLSRNDGSQRWRFDVPGEWIGTSPVVTDGTVYFGDDGGFVAAYDPEVDEEIWSYQTRGEVQSPVVTANRVYASSADGSVYAFNRR